MKAEFIRELLHTRQSRVLSLPVKEEASRFADTLLGILFPHFSETAYYSEDELAGSLHVVKRDLRSALKPLAAQMPLSVEETTDRFFHKIPDIYQSLLEDAEAMYQGDPAAESVDEVISAYPGFLAIAVHRIAHEFYLLEVPIFPRILTEVAHQRSGVDIHPGARIGRSLCIDHGTGIVIGETTEIGDNVKIYQGVTLGALSVQKSMKSSKRHPTIQDRVVIYSNATILGGSTVIGHDSIVGGNVWLTESVQAFSIIYNKSESHVRDTRGEEAYADYVI